MVFALAAFLQPAGLSGLILSTLPTGRAPSSSVSDLIAPDPWLESVRSLLLDRPLTIHSIIITFSKLRSCLSSPDSEPSILPAGGGYDRNRPGFQLL